MPKSATTAAVGSVASEAGSIGSSRIAMAIAVTAIDRRLTICPLVEKVGRRRQHLRGALVRARHRRLMPELRQLAPLSRRAAYADRRLTGKRRVW